MTPLFAHCDDIRPTRALYNAAADLIERNGLATGHYVCSPNHSPISWSKATENDCFCLIGALFFAARGNEPCLAHEENVLDGIEFKTAYDAVHFSDNTDAPTVVAKLRAIALTLKDA